MKAIVYVHGKGGGAAECGHYRPLFGDCEVIGLEYRGDTPWEASPQIRAAIEKLHERFAHITLIANSIGAYLCMHAGIDAMIRKAYFISPIVDMEQLIAGMMRRANVTEKELESEGVIRIASGEELSWAYLCYVRTHPPVWTAPTHILYGEHDDLTPIETVAGFAKTHNASLTVANGCEHWFHTGEQMRILDDWIKQYEGGNL